MADYYQGALMTVVASSASPEHGLFPPKISSVPTLARLPYRNRNGQKQGFFYVSSYNLDMDKQYQEHVQKSELLTRGWVFQEWLLSQRIVYFTPSGMFMECKSQAPQNERGEGTELWKDEEPPPGPTDDPAPPPSQDQLYSQKMSFALNTTTASGISRLWYDIVETYSGLALTKPSDRVVALSGIAKEFRVALDAPCSPLPTPASEIVQQQNLSYLSGNWFWDIHESLLWQQNPGEKGPPTKIPGFPSWSWTSASCPITWERANASRSSYLEAEILAVTNAEGVRFICQSSTNQSPVPTATTAAARLRLMNPSPRAFDVNTRIATLRINASLLWVVARERFSLGADNTSLSIAHTLSGCKETDGPWSQRSFWRKICSMEKQAEICGWGSFEHADYHGENLGQEVVAVLVSTTSVSGGGYSLGYIWPWHTVYNVVFVRGVEGVGSYERIGVGKLFGKEVEEGYRMAGRRVVELV
ncbi:hypothetical protein B0T16DRAFT_338662 [Cercophora newfieldiana]|uniref:Heterokaryon incompatibility domain-containing protein n=1 Tax=Cercophora newfieldiana TaxID=92897 RepID=A0AA39XTA8_9PEZI|nr:hypothetical protein B0T16DRAFT_338662 [Cercophora newfieldiana]